MILDKRPARLASVHLRLSSYLDLPAVLPLIPAQFGAEHRDVNFSAVADVPSVWAGFAVEVMLAAREAGRDVEFSRESLPVESDNDLQAAASFRRRIGVQDVTGQRHRVGAYVNVTTGDPDQLAAAAFVFGSVGVGLRVPEFTPDDFGRGRVWADRRGIPAIVGGLYVPVIGRSDGNFLAVATGQVIEMTPGFYRRYSDETICYLSEEIMSAPTAPPGFDRDRLLVDLEAFTRR